jgi:hypothetical protein
MVLPELAQLSKAPAFENSASFSFRKNTSGILNTELKTPATGFFLLAYHRTPQQAVFRPVLEFLNNKW